MISLVLPAYNPGQRVEQTWEAVQRFVAERTALRESWEAIFVLDGCTDGTAERLEQLTASSGPELRVVGYHPNRGKGFAVRTGLLAATGRLRIFTDIDLAYSFEEILRVADALRKGAPVAVASRAHPDSEVTLPAKVLGYVYRRHLQSRVFGALTRMLLPLHQHDTQAGLKGMTAEIAAGILPELICDGFGFDCELLTACSRASVPVEEIPVRVRYDSTASTTGLRTTLRMMRELLSIRNRWLNRTIALAPTESVIPAARAA